jgi:hypothetical protein
MTEKRAKFDVAPKITDYKLIQVHLDSIGEIVRKHLEKDWQPFGSPQLVTDVKGYVCQAMVKYEE